MYFFRISYLFYILMYLLPIFYIQTLVGCQLLCLMFYFLAIYLTFKCTFVWRYITPIENIFLIKFFCHSLEYKYIRLPSPSDVTYTHFVMLNFPFFRNVQTSYELPTSSLHFALPRSYSSITSVSTAPWNALSVIHSIVCFYPIEIHVTGYFELFPFPHFHLIYANYLGF